MVSGELLVALFYAIVSVTGAISPLSIKGTKFFNAEGQQVFFKGHTPDSEEWRLSRQALRINGVPMIPL